MLKNQVTALSRLPLTEDLTFRRGEIVPSEVWESLDPLRRDALTAAGYVKVETLYA